MTEQLVYCNQHELMQLFMKSEVKHKNGLFCLWHIKSGVCFYQKSSWNLSDHIKRFHWHVGFCTIEFHLAFPDAVADYVFQSIPEPVLLQYIHHGSMNVSLTMPPKGLKVTYT